MVKNERTSGILLHITSLPGPNGIGDVGQEAYKFIDFLVECNQKIWQILPLTASENPSPYSGISAFAANPQLINLEKLVDDGLLVQQDIDSTRPKFTNQVEFSKVRQWKFELFHRAFENYRKDFRDKYQSAIDQFYANEQYWLDDYTLYIAVKTEQHNQCWSKWPRELRQRNPEILKKKREQYRDIIDEHIFIQFIFFRQWKQLKEYAHRSGITILGDMPVYMSYDSADVWANQSLFQLDRETASPRAVSGAPPDMFSKAGQTWNNPLYDWTGKLRETKFDWWIKRLKKCLETVDIVRIDHFRGLESYWEIPIGSDGKAVPPTEGHWVKACGDEFFTAVQKELGNDLPIIVEDLGDLTEEVFNLRDKFGLTGMRVLQFGFSYWPNDMYLPHNYVRNCIAYTGTHDNNTTIAWFRHDASENEKEYLIKYLQKQGDPERDINWDLIRLVLASVANTAVLLFQDVLDLAENCRMNDPAFTPDYTQNWCWRFTWNEVKQTNKEKLISLTYIYGRHLPKEALKKGDINRKN